MAGTKSSFHKSDPKEFDFSLGLVFCSHESIMPTLPQLSFLLLFF